MLPFTLALSAVIVLAAAGLLLKSARAAATLLLLLFAGMLSAALEVLLVPLYVGATPLPVTVLFAVIGNVGLVLLARVASSTTLLAGLPLLGWLAVVLAFSLTTDEGDVLLPGSPALVSWGLLGCGGVAGVIALLRTMPRQAWES